MTNRLIAAQRKHNEMTRALRDDFRSHRDQVCRLARCGQSDQSIAVLGAGNGNDLDLALLGDAYRELHLVDLDHDALQYGLDQQQICNRGHVALHGGVDLTGILDHLANWSTNTPPTDDQISAAITKAIKHSPALPIEPCDRVMSTCVLSQLMHSVVSVLPTTHPRFVEMIRTVRLAHIRQMLELTKPGGRAVLITDVVSSATAPEITAVGQLQLESVVDRLIEARNFFHGVNPMAIRESLGPDSPLAHLIDSVDAEPYWTWKMGDSVYLVCAYTIHRASGCPAWPVSSPP